MGGFDEHVAIIGDGMPTSPSRRNFFPPLMGDDVGSRSITEPRGENKNAPLTSVLQDQITSVNADLKNSAQVGLLGDQIANSDALMDQNMISRGGLRERMAARAGFNALRLNTESIRPPDLTQNQEVQSPYLAFSSGLSPTVLLDSPVFLSNSLVQPSPTTGKFPFAPSSYGWNPTFTMDTPDKGKDNLSEGINASSFTFKPFEESRPTVFLGAASRSTPSTLPHQAFPNTEVSVQSENSRLPQSIDHSSGLSRGAMIHQQADLSRSLTDKDTGDNNISSEPRSFHSVPIVEQSPPLDEQQDEDVDQRGSTDQNIGGAPADDGYHWRKYGQKQVKGSEYPRSYYKCTHPNCPVKKKVERSHEGHVTEIIYKGAHNHPKPPPNRRSALGSSNGLSDMPLDNGEQAGFGDGDPGWTTTQKAIGAGASDWRHDNFEVTSSAQLGNEYSNGPTSLHQGGTPFECGETVDGSSAFSNDEDEDDHGTASVSLGYDGEGDESESKRRKLETYATEMSGATRAIREPRVVVQTTSEVDILDDGYRWRKYGQKVVKGNPNPRSYYKCTSAGCTVRKHVERASHDLKSVITTYEGKHNHDVPAARNSSHANSGVANPIPMQATSAVQSHIHRSEPSQIHNSMARFERPPAFGTFSLPGRPRLGPTQGFGFGMSQQGLASFATAGLGSNQGKLHVLPVHPYLGQPRPMNDMRFMLPKEEPKVEPMSDPGLNISSGSSVYNQIMSRLPLEPQM